MPGISQVGAAAATTNLYVDNAAAAHCSDSGSGAQAAPFCTVQHAADVAQPGQTVNIAAGRYPEQVKITRSGGAGAPITFVGTGSPVIASDRQAPYSGTAGLAIQGASHISVQGLAVGFVRGQETKGYALQKVTVDSSEDVTLTQLTSGGVAFTGQSQDVTLARSRSTGTDDPAVTVGKGVRHAVVTTNELAVLATGNAFGVAPGIVWAQDAPGTVVVSNTISVRCDIAVRLDGASSGSSVKNNVLMGSELREGPPMDCGRGPGSGDPSYLGAVTVSGGSVDRTAVDYNFFDSFLGGSGFQSYDWAGVQYPSADQFAKATGQGTHDTSGSGRPDGSGDIGDGKPFYGGWSDSADETAEGELPVDLYGNAAVDNALVPNTGTGSGFRDRGAVEYVDLGSVYTPDGPTRLLDTRSGLGGTHGPVASGRTIDLQVAGVGDIPPTVTAVTLNVTAVDPTNTGFLTVFPYGKARPTASNLNWTPGRTIPNLVTVPVVDGKVSLYVGGTPGQTSLIADLAGYYSARGSLYTPTDPTRVMDTRTGLAAPKQPLATGTTTDLQIAGVGGIPKTGVTAVTLNVTVTNPTGAGFLTVFPYGKDRPTASNLNWTAGRTIANLVTVPVVDGKVSFYAGGSPGAVDVLADLAGYYDATGYQTYYPGGPDRIMDTRRDLNVLVDTYGTTALRKAAVIPAGGTLTLFVAPAHLYQAVAATLNVTVTEPAAAGFLTVYRAGASRPTTSNLNWSAGETIANQVVANTDGWAQSVSFYNGSSGSIHLVVDRFGIERP
ncbi:hypothetical protein GCM10009760_24080 [Kitasatospora kazusensis]|uniref:Parallel beta helix pectate lyase-like protein n=1 Tax=Kitasatospora kazusensis TaxID=407974 RepID=A0ABP5L2A1_9ACTN